MVVAFSGAGFDWLRGEHLLTIRYDQGIASVRPYSYFVWANFAALVLCAGPMVAAGLLRALPVVARACDFGCCATLPVLPCRSSTAKCWFPRRCQWPRRWRSGSPMSRA